MYKDKPLIVQKRPWWRHPVFPWGWYSLVQDSTSLSGMTFTLNSGPTFHAEGQYSPYDGGGGYFTFKLIAPGEYDRPIFMPRNSDGTVGFVREFNDDGKIDWFGAKEDRHHG